MCALSNFIDKLYEYLTGNQNYDQNNIIRRHSKKIKELGDISFPLKIVHWKRFVNLMPQSECETIFDRFQPKKELDEQLNQLVKTSQLWSIEISTCKVLNKTDVHVFLNRTKCFDSCIKNVVESQENYGFQQRLFRQQISVINEQAAPGDQAQQNLTELRQTTLQTVAQKLINRLSYWNESLDAVLTVPVTTNSQLRLNKQILCGCVTNDNGVKDAVTTAAQLWNKRASDLRLIAEHKYGVRPKDQTQSHYHKYFEDLGRASVVIEMLENKPSKSVRIALSQMQTIHKGPSFIFYNCARLAAIFKEFESRVDSKMYPTLPAIDRVNFELLTQPEEWELTFVYLLQFPLVLKHCIFDIQLGIFLPQHLITFLSNLVQVFSAYYRRVKILIIAKDHLFPLLFARIYLLKALQQVFHNILDLLGIKPIENM